jgi:Restriction endonuclease
MPKPIAMQSFDILEIGASTVRLNGKKAPQELQDIGFYRTLEDFIGYPSACPYCKFSLLIVGNIKQDDPELLYENKQYHLWYCRNCRFWQWYYFFDYYDGGSEKSTWKGDGCPPMPKQLACISKLREFESRLPDSCSVELAQYLRSYPAEWHNYDPKRFEKLVADIFKANHAQSEVTHVGKPDDGGIDILLIDSIKEQWLVQVKRRARQKSAEGVTTIRNLIGTMMLEGARHGIVVSTADHFTLRAQQAAKQIKRQGLHIELIDKGVLDRMLEPLLPDRPWLSIVKEHDIEIANLLSDQITTDYQLKLFDYM